MIAQTHRVNHRVRAAAFQLVETLESRAYLSGVGGVVLGTPVNTPAAANNMAPVQVDCADFTGNSKDDVCVANQNDSISVLLSKGDGLFQTPVNSYPVAGEPLSLATGQFTGSGHLDIVAGTTGAGSAAGDVSILLGNGDGTFQSAINIPALQSNSAIAVGNFVTGGPLDIISASNSASHVNNVCLTITDGTGHLASQTFFSTPLGSVSSVAVGDFGNGQEDFAVSEQAAGSVSVYLGNGDGTFQRPVTYSTGAGTTPTSIVAGRFDASGTIGLVTADGTSGQVSFLANQGDGIFGTAVESPVAGSANGGGPLTVRLGQFVSDSEQDIVCLLSPGSSADATILLGNGDGTFRTGTTITTGGGNDVAAGDLAGTGLSDVVVASSSQISVLLSASFATLTNGVLNVTSLSAPSTIGLSLASGTYTVTENGLTPETFTASPVTQINIQGSSGNDSITVDASVTLGVSIQGGPGDDTITGGSGNDTLCGGQGSDSISGDQGDDSIKGGAGDDTLCGGKGNDTLFGSLGNDILRGGLGDDSLNGGAGTNQLYGGQGNNTFYCVNGTADQIFAGAATNDSLIYGSSDNYIIESGTIPPGNITPA